MLGYGSNPKISTMFFFLHKFCKFIFAFIADKRNSVDPDHTASGITVCKLL